jgi:aminoglycoside phosphotransferase (APT) family kinase protein
MMDGPDRLAAALEACRIAARDVLDVRKIDGGTYNTVYRIRRRDGDGLILKLAPGPDAPRLRYEDRMLATEALFDRLAAHHGVPVPGVIHVELGNPAVGGDLLLLRECPGTALSDHEGSGDDRRSLRAELGVQVARAHTVIGTGFGYPSEALGTLSGSWPEAFQQMVDAVLADAGRFSVTLPRPAGQISGILAAQAPALAEVRTPVLVHFDLWDGNILVGPGPDRLRLTALIDAERAFWGDPVADFVSLALLGDIERDEAFLDGYRQAGGTVTFDAATRRRLTAYRSYLDLIMLVEATPRQLPASHRQWLQDEVRPHLNASLDTLAMP